MTNEGYFQPKANPLSFSRAVPPMSARRMFPPTAGIPDRPLARIHDHPAPSSDLAASRRKQSVTAATSACLVEKLIPRGRANGIPRIEAMLMSSRADGFNRKTKSAPKRGPFGLCRRVHQSAVLLRDVVPFPARWRAGTDVWEEAEGKERRSRQSGGVRLLCIAVASPHHR